MTFTFDIYTSYLISSTGPTRATVLWPFYDGTISQHQVTRLLTNSSLDSKDVWLKSKPLIRSAEHNQSADDFAVLIIDDSILEKRHRDPNAMISTYWDPGQQRYVNGLNFVSLLYQLDTLWVPIAVRLMEKTITEWDSKTRSELTKNE